MTDDKLPIERGFPIEQVNEIAEKESRAGRHYRPVYTMHKWWARRLGCVFRTICLYTLLDDPEKINVEDPENNQNIEKESIQKLIDDTDISNPGSLWELYNKDMTVEDKKILDPFMGGGTSLVESSRFGANAHGRDLNPVAWFITKKEIDAGKTDIDELEEAFQTIKEEVSEELKSYYRTPCPNGDHEADVMYYMWVKELDCVSCGNTVSLFNDYRIGKGRYGNKGKYNVLCPDCESVIVVDDWRSNSVCSECEYEFIPEEGTVSQGYNCGSCGQKYRIVDSIQEQGGFDTRIYAVEYFCPECDEHENKSREDVKGYKSACEFDINLYNEAKHEWGERNDLDEYVPSENIPLGIMTDSTAFEGSIGGGHNVLRHKIEKWSDMFNERQLLGLSKILKLIDEEINDQNVKEYLLLALSDTTNTNNIFSVYNPTGNKVEPLFKTNAFQPPQGFAEGNIWGTKYGRGTFQSLWEMVKKGVEFANAPTERYMQNGDTTETPPFNTPIGENTDILLGDVRNIDTEDEYDAVITDPPYYDNIIYSEISNFFYVWQKIILEEEYEGFDQLQTPRAESIVANPAESKGEEEFEDEIRQAFSTIHTALKKDGVLTFTYHHSDSESWGELLESLCDVGFVVTATYPITADMQKFIEGETVEFDIILVARPTEERGEISWDDLRLQIYKTARETRRRLEKDRELSRGDIGVIEMGECFHEYSKYHGHVHRQGEIMNAKEVVDEIYGVIQEASEIGATEVFIDLIQEDASEFGAVNKLCRGANTRPEELKDLRLYNIDDGFELGTWDNEKRIAYLEDSLQEGDLSDLGKLQYLRYRYDREMPIGRYVRQWIDADLRELAGKLASATNDEIYEEMLEIRSDDNPSSASDGGGPPGGPNNEQSSIDDFS